VPVRRVNQLSCNGFGRFSRQYLDGIGWRHAPYGQARQAIERHRRSSPGPHREQEGHSVAAQAPCRKQQRGRRLTVEPLRVVDKHEDRALVGRRRQQRQSRRRHEKSVCRRVGGCPAKRTRQRRGLRRGHLVE
jgi:hypothetical protein